MHFLDVRSEHAARDQPVDELEALPIAGMRDVLTVPTILATLISPPPRASP